MVLKNISGVSFLDKKDVSRKALITFLGFVCGLSIITILFSGRHWIHHIKKHAIIGTNSSLHSGKMNK